MTVPDYAHLLPEPIRRFTKPSEIHDAEHLSFIQGGGHGGSHPHMVNEMLDGAGRGSRSVAERDAGGQLDLRRGSVPTSRP